MTREELRIGAGDDALAAWLYRPAGPPPWPVLEIVRHRPARNAARITCPLLLVVADKDTLAPIPPALRVAARAPRAELVRSQGGHYDVYAGGPGHEDAVRAELAFLRRHVPAEVAA